MTREKSHLVGPQLLGLGLLLVVFVGLGWWAFATLSLHSAEQQAAQEQCSVGPCVYTTDTAMKVWLQGDYYFVALASGDTRTIPCEVFGQLQANDPVGVVTCKRGWPWPDTVSVVALPPGAAEDAP